jgi:succinoglycan biosynthesis transport protein ExoP
MLYTTMTFRQGVGLIRANRLWFASILLLLLVPGLLLCIRIPAVYTASATLLFARPDLQTENDGNMRVPDAATEIAASGARILTLTHLRDIAGKRLYADSKPDTRELDAAATALKDKIRVDLLQSVPGKSDNTVGFTITYSHPEAAVAKNIVGDLVTMYRQDSDSEGARGSAAAVNLLQKEGALLKERVQKLEAKIAAFKEANADALPELHEYNLNHLAMLRQDLADLQRKIRDYQERRGKRRADLAETRPNSFIYTDDGKRLYKPAEQLELLEAQYRAQATRLSEQHPDMLAMQRSMAALRRQLNNPGSDTDALAAKTADEVFASLPAATPAQPVLRSYPKVQPSTAAPASASDPHDGRSDNRLADALAADNPVYRRLHAELESIDSEIALMQASEKDIRGKILEVEKRLSRAPEVERQLGELTRLYDNTTGRLADMVQREFDARLEAAIDANGAGARYVVAEPANVPDIPSTRKRKMAMLLCLLLALATSTALTLLRGARQRVIYDKESLASLPGMRAVVGIPKFKYAHA